MVLNSNEQAQAQTLNAAWRKYLVSVLGLDTTTFKLAQGTLGLGDSDNSGLFRISDNVPPNLAVYDAGSASSFSSSYQLLLLALLPETGRSLKDALGENYTNWIDYRNAYFEKNPSSDETQLQVFKKFANQRLDHGTAEAAINVFESQEESPLREAGEQYRSKDCQQTFTSDSGLKSTLKVYSPTFTDATKAINRGTGATIDFDSSQEEKSLTQSEIDAAASGFYDIFSGKISGAFEKLNEKATSSYFTIKGTIDKYATVPTSRGCWYSSGEYKRAYAGKDDNTIFDPDANVGTWDSFFGEPSGSLVRYVSQLLLLSGYTLEVTSHASYSQEDYQKIKTEASLGVWPFFSGSANMTHISDYKLNSDSTLTTTFTLNKGLIQVFGVNVLDAPNLLA